MVLMTENKNGVGKPRTICAPLLKTPKNIESSIISAP